VCVALVRAHGQMSPSPAGRPEYGKLSMSITPS
jgi:hypothetical protein